MLLVDPRVSSKLGILQSLDDAIAFRLSRLASPCDDCTLSERCDDHAGDEHLVDQYQERHGSVLREVLEEMDPEDIALVAQPGEDLPPTVIALSVVMIGQLRKLASEGIAVVDSDDA